MSTKRGAVHRWAASARLSEHSGKAGARPEAEAEAEAELEVTSAPDLLSATARFLDLNCARCRETWPRPHTTCNAMTVEKQSSLKKSTDRTGTDLVVRVERQHIRLAAKRQHFKL